MGRSARVERRTSESSVVVEVELDGTGQSRISTGVGFYDHMLTSLAKHALLDLTVEATGDVEIDAHHVVEDTAIVLGQALGAALGDKRGIRRFGDARVPLDEALAECVVDVAGRPYVVCSGEPDAQVYARIGGSGVPYAGSMTRHVVESLALNAGLCVHLTLLAGRDPHHIVEAQFKALARALRAAVEPDPRTAGLVPSTKGALSTQVAVLDYGSGNLHSVTRALAAAGAHVVLTADAEACLAADGLVVPGVGAYAACMAGLDAVGGPAIVRERLADGRPVLGICVGHQVMFGEGIEHGVRAAGLGILPGTVGPLTSPRLPHMGWNTVAVPDGSALFAGVAEERFYFVHSYAVHDRKDWPAGVRLAWAEHGGDRFVAAVEYRALAATQFHPEKSGEAGARLLRNWVSEL